MSDENMPDRDAPIKLVSCKPEKREPGLIYFTTRPGGLPTRAQFAWVIGVAQDGSLRLNKKYMGTSQDIRALPDGTLLFSQSAQGLINHIDLDGNILRQWHARGKYLDKEPPKGSTELPINFLHHTVNALPNGNFLTLDAQSDIYHDWPGSVSDRNAPSETAEVVGDVITEVTRDGDIVHRYHMLDMLDPYRPTHSTRSGYWQKLGFPNGFDWCHCNAVGYDADDDTLLASLRHQDCIVKFKRSSGELVWILGNHSEWKGPWSNYLLQPEGDLDWQYHQHDCSAPGPGRVMCFDNGSYKSGAFESKLADEKNYSRLVEFEVDAAKRTVRQVWSYGGPDSDMTYACYQGGALRLPKTGNTFGTYGGICFDNGKPTSNNVGTFGIARLVEVTPAGEIVFDMRIDDSESANPQAFSAFRATHVPEEVM